MQVLHLFHGRNSPDETLSDWGFDGPMLRINGFHCTYLETFRVQCEDDEWYDLSIVEGLIEYNGEYFGDWSINDPERLKFKPDSIPWYDPKLTLNKGV